MPPQDKGFDFKGFYAALQSVVASQQLTWKQVAEETGVGASTLARMAQGNRPDAASLAALSAWSGINPSDFVEIKGRRRYTEPIAQISTLLRSDPNLDQQSAEAVEMILRTAYDRLRKRD